MVVSDGDGAARNVALGEGLADASAGVAEPEPAVEVAVGEAVRAPVDEPEVTGVRPPWVDRAGDGVTLGDGESVDDGVTLGDGEPVGDGVGVGEPVSDGEPVVDGVGAACPAAGTCLPGGAPCRAGAGDSTG